MFANMERKAYRISRPIVKPRIWYNIASMKSGPKFDMLSLLYEGTILEKSRHGRPIFMAICETPLLAAGGKSPFFVRTKPHIMVKNILRHGLKPVFHAGGKGGRRS